MYDSCLGNFQNLKLTLSVHTLQEVGMDFELKWQEVEFTEMQSNNFNGPRQFD